MAEKINVLFIQSQTAFGADSLIHAEIMRHLDRDRFVVHCACTKGDGSGTPPSLANIQKIPDLKLRPTDFAPGLRRRDLRETLLSLRNTLAFPAEAAGLRKYVIDNDIRILHATEKPRDALYAYALSRVTPARSVVHVHVKWSDEYTFPAKYSVQHADAALAISEYVRDTIVGMGKPASQVYTSLNALDVTRWDPNLSGAEIRRELSIPDDYPVLASISRLFSWKGPKELIQATAIVRREFPNVRTLIVGADEVYVHGGSFTAELKRLVAELGLESNVIFTGFRRDTDRILAACDLFTMPSYEEPFGVVYLEAMAMKKPVLSIDNGGTPEVVTNGKAGLLSAPWNVEQLADNILQLLRDPERRRAMGEFARQRVLDYFTPQRMAREVGEIYERILAA